MNQHVNEMFLSAVLGRPVIDETGRSLGRLRDLVMAPADPLPVVTHLVVSGRKGRGGMQEILWRDVALFNPVVVSVRAGAVALEHRPESRETLLRRDILDKQIVDVDGARVVRVNDVKLVVAKDLLAVSAVDVGLRGLLRRLGYLRGWDRLSRALGKETPPNEIGWHYVQPLEMNVSRLTLTVTRDRLGEMHPADLAQIISQLPRQHIHAVLSSVDHETAGEAISELEPELSMRVINELSSDAASDILEEMPPDEAADVLGDLPPDKAQEILELMNPEDAEKVQELLLHEEDTAGGLMNNEFIELEPDTTCGRALEIVRLVAEDVDTIYYLYVLDNEERLLGVISLRELLTSPPESAVAAVMAVNVKTVGVEATPEEVMELIVRYNLISVPVLDAEEKMVGIVTFDDILELFLPFALKRKRQLRNF